MKNIIVQLTQPEMDLAIEEGRRRHAVSRERKLRLTAHAPDNGRLMSQDAEGAAGELAYCICAGIPWEARINNFKEADVQHDVQVRHTVWPHGKLMYRKDDNPQHFFVLTVGRMPVMRVVGWLIGSEAKRLGPPGRLDREKKGQITNNVEQFDLNPFPISGKPMPLFQDRRQWEEKRRNEQLVMALV